MGLCPDREGSLFVFRVPKKSEPVEQEATAILKNVGDGNDLKVVDQGSTLYKAWQS